MQMDRQRDVTSPLCANFMHFMQRAHNKDISIKGMGRIRALQILGIVRCYLKWQLIIIYLYLQLECTFR
jgi:hypothetical protein